MADTGPFTFLPLGAIIQSIRVKDTNIVLGFPTAEDYTANGDPYFGETIGRVANRLGGARLDSLNSGQTYPLAANNGPNNLHGGIVGWGKRVWDGPKSVGVRDIPGVQGLGGGESVQFSLVSNDGEEGFPGKVEATVTYTVGTQDVEGKEVSVLGIEYEARLVGGADETAINMTNHSYFNLANTPSIEGTIVTLATNVYLPVDDGGIPTAGPAVFPQTVVQPGKEFTLGASEPDIDDCFVLDADPAAIKDVDTRGAPLRLNVAAHHPASGVHLEVLSTEPAFQFYTGKYIDVPAVGDLPARRARSGFCVEPSRYVNAANVPEWRHMMVLKKGEVYGCRIVYRTWAE